MALLMTVRPRQIHGCLTGYSSGQAVLSLYERNHRSASATLRSAYDRKVNYPVGGPLAGRRHVGAGESRDQSPSSSALTQKTSNAYQCIDRLERRSIFIQLSIPEAYRNAT